MGSRRREWPNPDEGNLKVSVIGFPGFLKYIIIGTLAFSDGSQRV